MLCTHNEYINIKKNDDKDGEPIKHSHENAVVVGIVYDQTPRN